jgi:hypothetical protein
VASVIEMEGLSYLSLLSSSELLNLFLAFHSSSNPRSLEISRKTGDEQKRMYSS